MMVVAFSKTALTAIDSTASTKNAELEEST
jgi:hypothetical protein